MSSLPLRAMALLAGLLAGCGAAVSVPQQQVLTVLLADDWASETAVIEAVKDFEAEHDNVRVSLRSLPFGQIEEAIVNDLEGGRDVDVAQYHAFAAGARGYAIPVDGQFADAFPEGTFVSGAVEDVTWGGHVYGVPLDVNALVLLVNETLLAEVGHTLGDLATFDGVMEVAASLADLPGDTARITSLAGSGWVTYGWVRANGGEVMAVDADGFEVTLAAPEVVEALEFIGRLASEHEGRSLAYKPPANDLSVDGFSLFQDGSTLMHATGTWDVAKLQANDPEWNWTTVPLPSGPSADGRATALGGSSLYVPRGAEDVDLAFEFMAHMIEPEYSLRYAKDSGRLPPQVAVLDDPYFDDPVYRTVVEELPRASAMRLVALPTANDAFANAIAEVIQGRAVAADELDRAQDRAMESIDELPEPPA